jgi:hypothetical protein
MTDTRSDSRRESFYAQRETVVSPPAERPWPLVALAVACIAGVIAGSLGPWAVFERISETAPDTWAIPGYRSDGLFGLVFAVAALVALGAALFREGNASWAWTAFGAMALCALIGLADWFMFAPPDRTIAPGETGTVERLGWGVKVVGVAGPVGALATFLIARRLNRGDF